VDLGLNDNASADSFCGGFSLLGGHGRFAPGHRDSIARQEGLGLIFVNFHCVIWIVASLKNFQYSVSEIGGQRSGRAAL
jgi:hypothetical protein